MNATMTMVDLSLINDVLLLTVDLVEEEEQNEARRLEHLRDEVHRPDTTNAQQVGHDQGVKERHRSEACKRIHPQLDTVLRIM